MRTRVFIVDDEQIIADTLAAILNASGYEARQFYDGAAALKACEGGFPDCVISDVVMPRLNGIELAVQIRQRYPACKVLLFSGQAATAKFLDRAREDGYEFEVLLKPVHPADLLARLEVSSRVVPEAATEKYDQAVQ